MKSGSASLTVHHQDKRQSRLSSSDIDTIELKSHVRQTNRSLSSSSLLFSFARLRSNQSSARLDCSQYTDNDRKTRPWCCSRLSIRSLVRSRSSDVVRRRLDFSSISSLFLSLRSGRRTASFFPSIRKSPAIETNSKSSANTIWSSRKSPAPIRAVIFVKISIRRRPWQLFWTFSVSDMWDVWVQA